MSTFSENRPAVSIVIPVWNAADVTDTCLRLLSSTVGPDDEVIVVDNGSTDHTADVLAQHGSWTTTVVHGENLGFAAGCNAGAALATRPVVIFLNNDTLPVPGWLENMLHAFSAPDVGAVGPTSNRVSGAQMVDDPGYTPTSLDELVANAAAVHDRHGADTVEVDRLVGFCLAVRRDVHEALGGFDTSFSIGSFEDDDISRRIRRAGLRLLVARGAFVHHVCHQTFEANAVDRHAWEAENRTVLQRKEAAQPDLSVLVHCDGSTGGLAATLDEVVRAGVPERTELLVLTTAAGVDAPSVPGIGQVRVVMIREGDDPWRSGLLRAGGTRRALVRTGEHIDGRRLRRLIAGGDLVAPARVSVPRPAAPSVTSGSDVYAEASR